MRLPGGEILDGRSPDKVPRKAGPLPGPLPFLLPDHPVGAQDHVLRHGDPELVRYA